MVGKETLGPLHGGSCASLVPCLPEEPRSDGTGDPKAGTSYGITLAPGKWLIWALEQEG